MIRLALFLALLVLVLVTGCGFPKTGAAPPALAAGEVTAATTKWPDATPAELTAGHDAFIAKCNGCHGYPDLATISADRWPDIMARMGKKADLDAKSTQAVLRFVSTPR